MEIWIEKNGDMSRKKNRDMSKKKMVFWDGDRDIRKRNVFLGHFFQVDIETGDKNNYN